MRTLEEIIAENTHEAFLWLENDETLYLKAKKCRNPNALKRMWALWAPKGMINTRYTDWKQLFIDTREET